MLLQKYLNTIDTLNPRKIYVENVRAALKVSTFKARLICEMAVADNLFEKRIGIICPNNDCHKIIVSYSDSEDIPDTINCSICEMDDERESTFYTKDLEKLTFYRLKKHK